MADKREMKPHKPARVKSPILERMKGRSPGGPHTPGEKMKRTKHDNKDSDGHRMTGVNR